MAKTVKDDEGAGGSQTRGAGGGTGRVPQGNPMAYAQQTTGRGGASTQSRYTPTTRSSIADLIANLPPPGAARDWYIMRMSPNQRKLVNRATDGGLFKGDTSKGPEKVQVRPTKEAVDAYKKQQLDLAAQAPRPHDMLEDGRAGRGQFGDVGDAERGRYGAYHTSDAGYNPALDDATVNAINPTIITQADPSGSAQKAIDNTAQVKADNAASENKIFDDRMAYYNPPSSPAAPPAGPGAVRYQAYTAPAVQLQNVGTYKVNMDPMAGFPSTPNAVNYQNRDFKPVMPQGGLTQQQGQQLEALRQRQSQPVNIQRAATPDLTNARNLSQQILANSRGPAAPGLAAKYGASRAPYTPPQQGMPAAQNTTDPMQLQQGMAQKQGQGPAPANMNPSFMPSTPDWRKAMTKG